MNTDFQRIVNKNIYQMRSNERVVQPLAVDNHSADGGKYEFVIIRN
jgi:hypothetical protein